VDVAGDGVGDPISGHLVNRLVRGDGEAGEHVGSAE
jgi:hypothetical protein